MSSDDKNELRAETKDLVDVQTEMLTLFAATLFSCENFLRTIINIELIWRVLKKNNNKHRIDLTCS